MDAANDANAPSRRQTDRRLNSWKAIGAFFDRDERTVRRWEAERGLPVHRVPGAGRSSVYAYTNELAKWLETADAETLLKENEAPAPLEAPSEPGNDLPSENPSETRRIRSGAILIFSAISLLVLAACYFVVRRFFFSPPVVATALPAGMKHAANPEAKDLYLEGLYHWNKRTPQDLNQAVDDFTQAIVRDPNYAPAYVGLANCYNLLREYSLMPAKEAYPRAIAAAQRAIALDDSLAEAHNSLAFGDFYWAWDAAGAEREFRRAIELDPKSVLAHHWYATFLMVLGREDEALAEIEKAQELDPKSSAILADKGLILYIAGHADQAIVLLKHIEASDPSFLSPHSYLELIYLQGGDYKNFLAEARKSAVLRGDQERVKVVTAGERGYASGRGPGMLRGMLQVQQEQYAQGKLEAYELAATYNLLGDKKRALELLQVSVKKREPRDVALRVDQYFQSLHGEPGFGKLLAQVGLPPLG